MTSAAISLILLSALLHAGWNAASKSARSTVGFFAWANLFGVVLLLPVAWACADLFRKFPRDVFVLLVVTGFFELVYFVGLARAYRAGELSLTYPLSRALSVLFVGVVSPPEGIAAFGMVFVVVGCLLLPLERFSEWRPARYLDGSSAFAALAAAGTAGYSIVDAHALELLRENLGHAPEWRLSLAYLLGDAVFTSLWLVLYARWIAPSELTVASRGHKASAAFVGAASYVTYGLVLWAMHFVVNVSYVVALRQVAVVFSVALGALVLGERAPAPRIVGAAVASAGLVLVALG